MEGNMYYIVMAVIAIIAVVFFRGGHLLLSLLTVILGGWIYYNHDKNIDISDTLYKTIDKSAKSNYEKKYKTEAYDYNTSKVE